MLYLIIGKKKCTEEENHLHCMHMHMVEQERKYG